MQTDTKWKVALAMHPKQVTQCTEAQIKYFFFNLIENPGVSAIGIVGLDTSWREGNRRV